MSRTHYSDDDEDREASAEHSSDCNEGNMVPSGADLEGEREVEALIDAEERSVQLWRWIVGLMLFATAMLVTLYTNKFLADQERLYFETSVSTQSNH
jgi:hypothetical protein